MKRGRLKKGTLKKGGPEQGDAAKRDAEEGNAEEGDAEEGDAEKGTPATVSDLRRWGAREGGREPHGTTPKLHGTTQKSSQKAK